VTIATYSAGQSKIKRKTTAVPLAGEVDIPTFKERYRRGATSIRPKGQEQYARMTTRSSAAANSTGFLSRFCIKPRSECAA